MQEENCGCVKIAERTKRIRSDLQLPRGNRGSFFLRLLTSGYFFLAIAADLGYFI